jgi:hypothetical protein
MTKRFVYSLCAGLILFVLPLSCNGPNSNNSLKSKNKTTEPHIKSTGQAGVSDAQDQAGQYVPHEILVKFNPDTDPQTIAHIQAELKLITIRQFRSPNLFLMKITDNATVEAVIEKLKTYQAVKYAEPNYVVKAN